MGDEPAAAVRLQEELRAGGFDVFTPMRVSWYNDYLKKLGLATNSTTFLEEAGVQHASGEEPFRLTMLPDFGRADGNALAFLIGNSKAMWPRFVSWLRDHPEVKDPVDTYTEETVRRVVRRFVGTDTQYDIFWANDMTRDRLVDMNRAAATSATCYFSDDMYLSIHPTFGSWVAFRAVVVLDADAAHLGPAPAFLPSLLSDEERQAAKAAFAEALRASSEVQMSVNGMPLELARKWEELRDCVKLGREYKYSKLQSEYHYTKDPKMLSTVCNDTD